MNKIGIFVTLIVVTIVVSVGYCSVNECKHDARILSLGNSFAGDPQASLHANPASINRGQSTINYTYSELAPLGYSSEIISISLGQFGIAIVNDVVSDVAGSDYKEKSLIYSMNKQVGSIWSVGANLRDYKMTCGDLKSSAYSFDLGLLRRAEKVSVGLVLSNLGCSVQDSEGFSEPIFPEIRAGASISLNSYSNLNVDLTDSKKVYIGYQLEVAKGAQLRAGFDEGSLRIGFGLKSTNILCDYVFAISDLSNEQRFTIGLKF